MKMVLRNREKDQLMFIAKSYLTQVNGRILDSIKEGLENESFQASLMPLIQEYGMEKVAFDLANRNLIISALSSAYIKEYGIENYREKIEKLGGEDLENAKNLLELLLREDKYAVK